MVISESESVPICRSALHFLATGDVTTSWLAADTSDEPYAVKLASGDNSVCRRHRYLSRIEPQQFTPLQLSLQWFHFIVSLWCKLNLKERETTNITKTRNRAKMATEGYRFGFSCFTWRLKLRRCSRSSKFLLLSFVVLVTNFTATDACRNLTVQIHKQLAFKTTFKNHLTL